MHMQAKDIFNAVICACFTALQSFVRQVRCVSRPRITPQQQGSSDVMGHAAADKYIFKNFGDKEHEQSM